MGTGEILLVGNYAMDYHPVQGGVAILLRLLHAKETGISFSPFGPLARVRLYLYFIAMIEVREEKINANYISK